MESARKFNNDVRASREILLFVKITNKSLMKKKKGKIEPALQSKRDLQVSRIQSVITDRTEFSDSIRMMRFDVREWTLENHETCRV